MKDFDADLAKATSLTPVELQAAVQRAGDFGHAGATEARAKPPVQPSVPTLTISETKLELKPVASTTISPTSGGDPGAGSTPLTNTTIWLSKAGVATEYNIYLSEV